MPAANWYYSQNGQSMGPVTPEVIQQMLNQGALKPQDLVWRDGMQQWAAVSTIPELAGPVAEPVASSPFGQQQGPYAQMSGYPSFGATGPLNYYTPTPQFSYAGFWKRFAAAFIDGILLYVVGLLISTPIILAAGGDMSDVFGVNRNRAGTPDLGLAVAQMIASLLQLVVNWLYCAMMESSSKQATLGKQALGIIVTDEYGQRISFGRATGRFFAEILSSCTCLVGYIMAGFTQKKQALHDMICKTLVIDR